MNTPLQKLFGWFRRPQLWATDDWQLHHDNVSACSGITSHVEFFGETWNPPGDSAPVQPRFGDLWLLAFPKTKITFEREEISDCPRDSGKYNEAADDKWEKCVRSQDACYDGDWGITVLCTVFLVSSSINISIFHITWLDTFWTDVICFVSINEWCIQDFNVGSRKYQLKICPIIVQWLPLRDPFTFNIFKEIK